MPSGNETLSQSSISPLLLRLANYGVRWVEAEISLASAEYHVLRRRYFTAAGFALIAFIFTLTAVFVFAQAGIVAAAMYFNSAILAGLAAGSLLLVMAALCFIAMQRALRWQARGLILRLFESTTDSNPKQQWTH